MAKIQVCDLCLEKEKYTKTLRYISIRKTHCRIDVCPAHALEIKPLSTIDFVKLSYRLSGVPDMDTETAKKILVGGR